MLFVSILASITATLWFNALTDSSIFATLVAKSVKMYVVKPADKTTNEQIDVAPIANTHCGIRCPMSELYANGSVEET